MVTQHDSYFSVNRTTQHVWRHIDWYFTRTKRPLFAFLFSFDRHPCGCVQNNGKLPDRNVAKLIIICVPTIRPMPLAAKRRPQLLLCSAAQAFRFNTLTPSVLACQTTTFATLLSFPLLVISAFHGFACVDRFTPFISQLSPFVAMSINYCFQGNISNDYKILAPEYFSKEYKLLFYWNVSNDAKSSLITYSKGLYATTFIQRI